FVGKNHVSFPKTLAFLRKTVYHIPTQIATAPKSQSCPGILLLFVQIVKKFSKFQEEAMRYHSTRSPALEADSAQAVLTGLAPDGGLYMPERIPAFDWQAALQGTSQD